MRVQDKLSQTLAVLCKCLLIHFLNISMKISFNVDISKYIYELFPKLFRSDVSKKIKFF